MNLCAAAQNPQVLASSTQADSASTQTITQLPRVGASDLITLALATLAAAPFAKRRR
jgi:hypothetical protein